MAWVHNTRSRGTSRCEPNIEGWRTAPTFNLAGLKYRGIRVQVLSGPEGADEQLITWRKLLESGTEGPDVYGIDVIWPGILADNLLDLTNAVCACARDYGVLSRAHC
jgi:hypothetical protein